MGDRREGGGDEKGVEGGPSGNASEQCSEAAFTARRRRRCTEAVNGLGVNSKGRLFGSAGEAEMRGDATCFPRGVTGGEEEDGLVSDVVVDPWAEGGADKERAGGGSEWRTRMEGGGQWREAVTACNVLCVTPLVPLLPETGKLWPRNHRRVGACGGRGCRCWTWRGVGTHLDAAGAPTRVYDGRVQMHHPCEPPYPGRGCTGWIRPASEQLGGVQPAEGEGGRRCDGGEVEGGAGAATPKRLLQHDRHGRVQLHRRPREPPCEGRGCGDWKRPASWRRAGGRRRHARRRREENGESDERWRLVRWGWRHLIRARTWRLEAWTRTAVAEESLARSGAVGVGRWTCDSGPREEGSGQMAQREWRRGGRWTGKGEGRIGEARNPGPPLGGEEAVDGGGMTVEEAWARVQEEKNWVPAWKTWSRQVVRIGGQDRRLDFALVPPLVAEEEEEERAVWGREEWEEEELEAFLQQCELEAGLIQEVDAEELRRRSDSWRAWEEETTMAGIACPRLEEQGSHGEERGDQAAVEVAERVVPPPREQRRATSRAGGGR